jgi:hypothetical protein
MSVVSYDFTNEDNDKTFTGEVDANNYFKSVNDVKEFLLNKEIRFEANNEFEDNPLLDIKNAGSSRHFINEVDDFIIKNANKLSFPRFINEIQPFSKTKRSIRRLIDNIPSYHEKLKSTYESDYQQLLQIEKETKMKSWDLFKHNWMEIKEFLSSMAVNKDEQAKQRLKISQAKYYQKKKALLGIEPRQKLTPEEKAERYKEQLKNANKKYYEKKRTELLELGVMKPKQTEEEKRIAKQEANKAYYASKKQKKAVDVQQEE